MIFRDRFEAGRTLGEHLPTYADRADVLVLGLPRGGVPVAFEVARRLDVPLDVFLVRKLGVPGHEELAMGAIAGGGIRVLNTAVVQGLGITDADVTRAVEREEKELARRLRAYRGNRPPLEVTDMNLVLVDDGLATGATMRAAVLALRQQEPARIVVAVPLAATQTCDALATVADEVVCVATPEPFHAVGFWYEDFGQVSDADVRTLLDRAAESRHSLVA
jgi:putative phosphoribosyl transferase